MTAGAELVVLGAGTILPRPGLGCAGYALRPAAGARWVLLDCGPGSIRALGDAGIGVADIAAVVFSHYHLDHCLDLFALFFARGNAGLGALGDLTVLGPAGLLDFWVQGRAAFGKLPEVAGVVGREFSVDRDGRWESDLALDGHTVHLAAVANGHTHNAVSWRVGLPDGTQLVYTGDTGECAAVAALARGADLMIAECSFPTGRESEHHLTPASAARLAAQAKRVLLTHFYPGVEPGAAVAEARACGVPAFAAHDQLRIPLGRPAEPSWRSPPVS